MSEASYTRLSTIVSFTIAILTLFSGLLGWQMGNISGEAASEYSRAQRAELNRQKIASTNALKAYEDYRAFLVYKNYFDQYKLVSLELERARKAETPDEKLITQLASKRDELESLYLSSLRLFPNQFINRDGTYNIQEELGQLNATEARKLDTNPDVFQKRGELYDQQVGKMQIALITLAVSLFFFAIVSTVTGLNKATLIIFTALGYIAAVSGVVMGVSNWKPAFANEPISADLSQQSSNALSLTNLPAQTITLTLTSVLVDDYTHSEFRLPITDSHVNYRLEVFSSEGSLLSSESLFTW